MIKISEDKLKRNSLLNELFDFFKEFGNQDGHGLTMLLNGSYGSGKSTVLNFICEKNNIEQNYNIIKYDAWENNLFANPLIPLLYKFNDLKKSTKIKNGAKNLIRNIPKAVITTFTNLTGIDADSLMITENIFEEYLKYEKSITQYKKILTNYCKEKKLILLVDELDRCLPEYQIKVLEILYHFFDIANLIIVIALDKFQLEEAIKNKFGESLQVDGYLAKFIKYQKDLPTEETYDYIKILFNFKSEYEKDMKEICANTFKIANLGIRQCKILIEKVNIICNEVDQNNNKLNYYYWYPLLVTVLLIIRNHNEKLYNKYFIGYESKDYYSNKKALFKDTKYFKFLNEISNTIFSGIIDYFTSISLGQSFLFHLINVLVPVSKIKLDELADYLCTDVERVDNIIHNYDSKVAEYDTINKILHKVKLL